MALKTLRSGFKELERALSGLRDEPGLKFWNRRPRHLRFEDLQRCLGGWGSDIEFLRPPFGVRLRMISK